MKGFPGLPEWDRQNRGTLLNLLYLAQNPERVSFLQKHLSPLRRFEMMCRWFSCALPLLPPKTPP